MAEDRTAGRPAVAPNPQVHLGERPRCVVLLSGGIDSATLLAWAIDRGWAPHVLHITYGQRHAKEQASAEAVAKHYGVTWLHLSLEALSPVLGKSALMGTAPVPHVPETAEHYETLKITVVPNRNSILLSIAVAWAVTLDARAVFYAAHYSDRGVYPDCRREFVEAFQGAERLANDLPDLTVGAPFVDMTKAELVSLGVSLKVPYELTWSCYEGGQVHCGECSSCRERRRAFQEAGVPDPTIYR